MTRPMRGSGVHAVMRSLFPCTAAALALAACNRHGPSDRLDDNQVAANATPRTTENTTSTATPAKRCAAGRTYDLIQHELFRRAAELRGKDDAIFDRLAAAAALRVERPLLKSSDDGLGSIACSATVSLDLPPGLAVAGGRSSLTTDLDYTLQPAADGSGDVVTLTNSGAMIVLLATLGKAAGAAPPRPVPSSSPPTPVTIPALPVTPTAPVVRPAPDPLAPR